MNTKTLTVHHLDGTEEQLTISPIELGSYNTAFSKSADEMDFVAFANGKTRQWITTLSPESYEELYQAVEEVNPSFQHYAQRQQAKLNAQNRAMFEALADMPPETLQSLAQAGTQVAKDTPPRPRSMTRSNT